MRFSTSLAVALAASLAECATASDARTETSGATANATRTVDAPPIVSIRGTRDADSLTPFGQIVGAAHLSDGGDSLYVRDLELRQYKVFSFSGSLVRSFALPLHSSGLQAVSSACNTNATFMHCARGTNADLPLNWQIRRLVIPF